MPASKKEFDNLLQEVRSKNKNKIQYLKRKQEEEEANKHLKESLRRELLEDDDDAPF